MSFSNLKIIQEKRFGSKLFQNFIFEDFIILKPIKVHLSMRNEVSYVKVEINGLGIYISKSWLHKKSFEVQPEKRFIDLLESTLGQRHPAEVAIFVDTLNDQLIGSAKKEGKPRYVTWRPHAFLCKNTNGKYAPWWSHHDFEWDRCKNRYGNNNDGKEYEDVECECDDKCMERSGVNEHELFSNSKRLN